MNRDPKEEEGGLNLYGFVGNGPVDSFDILGLWWPNEHRNLTILAWNWLVLPQGLSPSYDQKMLSFIADANVDVDSSLANKLEWHFNRKIGESYASGIDSYVINQAARRNDFYKQISAPSEMTCRDSLFLLGRLTHSWQDYYAHAVNLKYGKGDPDFLIGSIVNPPLLVPW